MSNKESVNPPQAGARRLRLLRTIHSDLPFPPFLTAMAGVYEGAAIDVNPHGAVSVMTDGGWLGVMPHEMEWIDVTALPAQPDELR